MFMMLSPWLARESTWLVAQQKTRFILMRQSIFPNKDRWAAWLSDPDAGTCGFGCMAIAQADTAAEITAAANRYPGRIDVKDRLMLNAEHLPATVGAMLASHNAILHIADLVAFQRTGFANLCANFVQAMQKMRSGQLEICQSLADLGAVQHQSQMFGFDMFPARFQAMVHRSVQTNLVAKAACGNTRLRCMFRLGYLMHGVLR
ncbi:hypothetical protein [Methylomonas koyamae]|uniref:hypothetical protein n=1 Tax=Methylomonas koyamae TaxID=702114 RepID=UPI0016423EF3|nr:hypothetical protein [Methylomonas koyamae]